MDAVDNARRAEFDEHVYPLLVPNWAGLARHVQDGRLRAVSPRYLVDDILGSPSFLFLHGGADHRTPSAPMLRYAATLIDRGYSVEVHLLDGAGHALAERYDRMLDSIIVGLDRTVGSDVHRKVSSGAGPNIDRSSSTDRCVPSASNRRITLRCPWFGPGQGRARTRKSSNSTQCSSDASPCPATTPKRGVGPVCANSIVPSRCQASVPGGR